MLAILNKWIVTEPGRGYYARDLAYAFSPYFRTPLQVMRALRVPVVIAIPKRRS